MAIASSPKPRTQRWRLPCPRARIAEVIEGLKGTHKGGVRYPIPSFLRYQAVFPEKYMKLEELWRQGEEHP